MVSGRYDLCDSGLERGESPEVVTEYFREGCVTPVQGLLSFCMLAILHRYMDWLHTSCLVAS